MILSTVLSAETERSLAIFDAFLNFARGTLDAAPRVSTLRGDDLDREVTHMVAAPAAPGPPSWDDETEEQGSPPGATPEERTDLSVPLPEAHQAAPSFAYEERSIIVDDDVLTSPEIERASVPMAIAPGVAPQPSALATIDTLLQEMAVLVKYGHSAQAAEELDRWSQQNPYEFDAHMRVAEFEMARLDRERALQRYGALVSAFKQRGDVRTATDILRRLRRDMPEDPRIHALAQWNGLT